MPRSKESKAARQATIKNASATGKVRDSSVAKKQYDESELEWVARTVTGYIPDGFHGYCEPEQEVSVLHDVSPADREGAVEKLHEKMGKAFSGWEWSEMVERTEMVVEADEPGRCETLLTLHGGLSTENLHAGRAAFV